jgi:hypothetical protein
MDQFMNIVTFGASGRVESAKKELERRYAVYQIEFTALERRREQVAVQLEDLVTAKQQAYRSLRRVRQVTKSLSPRERFEVDGFYWTDSAPDIVNPGREGQSLVSV